MKHRVRVVCRSMSIADESSVMHAHDTIALDNTGGLDSLHVSNCIGSEVLLALGSNITPKVGLAMWSANDKYPFTSAIASLRLSKSL